MERLEAQIGKCAREGLKVMPYFSSFSPSSAPAGYAEPFFPPGFFSSALLIAELRDGECLPQPPCSSRQLSVSRSHYQLSREREKKKINNKELIFTGTG